MNGFSPRILRTEFLARRWNRWTTPRSTDADEAFREKTIRWLLPPLVVVFGLFFVVQGVERWQAGETVFTSGYVFEAVGLNLLFVASFWALLAGRIRLSATLLVLRLWFAIIVTIYLYSYAAGSVLSLLLLFYLLAILVLPPTYIWPTWIVTVCAYLAIAWVQINRGFLVADAATVMASPSLQIFQTVATTTVVGLFFIYLRQGYDSRVAENVNLVETLEDRVLQRTQQLAQAMEEVETAHQELQRLGNVQDRFLISLAQELSVPITNIKLRHYLLKRSASEEQIAHLDALNQELDRAENLLHALTLLTDLERMPAQIVRQPVDMVDLVNKCLDEARPMAEAAPRVALGVADGTPEQVWADVDALLMRKVLKALLANAITYSLAGGEVAVALLAPAQPHPEALPRPSADAEQIEWIHLSVADKGMGITPEEMPHIFDRFYRGLQATEVHPFGIGLDLSIAYELIVRHNGCIRVVSAGQEGEGATVHVWLPAAPVPETAPLPEF